MLPTLDLTEEDAVYKALKQLGVVLLNVLAAQLLGYLCLLPTGPNKTTVMTPQAIAGLGSFAGLISLPAILFRAVAILDFSTVDPSIVIGLFTGKALLFVCSYVLGHITADDEKPGEQMLTAGCLALLTTNSDDLGLGLPVLGAIFPPELVDMCFVLNALQSMVFNPLIFLVLGIGAARRDAPTDGTPPASSTEVLISVLRGLCKNHTVLAVVLGLLYNVACGGLHGAALPFWLDNLAKLLGQAFGPIVLFMAGAATVGAFSHLAELHSAIMPIATVLLKSILLPALVLAVVTLVGGAKDVLDFGFTFASLPTAASTLVFAAPYRPDAATRSLLNAGLALGKLIGFPLLFVSAAIFKTDDVHDIVVIEASVAAWSQLVSAVALVPMLCSILWYPRWCSPPLRSIYTLTLLLFGYVLANLYAQKTPEQTAEEFAVVSFFRWASEVALMRMALVRVLDARHQMRALANAKTPSKAAAGHGRGPASVHGFPTGSDLAQPLMPLPSADDIEAVSHFRGAADMCGPLTYYLHLTLDCAGGLLLTLPWYLGCAYPVGTPDEHGGLRIEGAPAGGGQRHSHLPLWLPYEDLNAKQPMAYAGVYAVCAIGLFFATGSVLHLEHETKQLMLASMARKRERGVDTKEYQKRICTLETSHNLYVRFECLIFLAVTRQAIGCCICAELAVSDNLTGAMALMLLVHSVLANAFPLVLFFLFGVGEGVFDKPLLAAAAALKAGVSLLGLGGEARGATRRPIDRRSLVVDQVLERIEGSAESTGFAQTNLAIVVRRASAATKLQRWARRAKKTVAVRKVGPIVAETIDRLYRQGSSLMESVLGENHTGSPTSAEQSSVRATM